LNSSTLANNTPGGNGNPMRRHLIGISAIALLLLAMVATLHPGGAAFWEFCQAACWKVGLVMAFWWLAYPEAVKLPVWLWFVVPAVLVALMLRGPARLLVLVLLAAMVVLAMFKPRPSG
jgi:hypothetical protein